MRRVVINADDFGICTETNQAIELAYERGILTSASLMPNMPGFDHAVATIIPRVPDLGLGVHLVLTSGRPVADPASVPLLVDGRGMFRRSFGGILALTSGRRAALARDQIERELTAQFERVRAARVAIDHVNSHQHVHMIPAVWRIVVRLAARYGAPAGRPGGSPDDPAAPAPFRRAGGLTGHVLKRIVLAACAGATRRLPSDSAAGVAIRHPDRFAAVMNQRGMDRWALARRLASVSEGLTEIVTHPSVASLTSVAALTGSLSRADVMFLSSPGRRLELEALMDEEIGAIVRKQGIELTSFRVPATTPPLRVGAAGR